MKTTTLRNYRGKFINNKVIYFYIGKVIVKSKGGENMTEEKLIFIEPEEIPKTKGNIGRKWSELFNKIPINKTLEMDTEIYGSSPNIRTQVKNYNKDGNNLEVTQRTINEKTVVYVTRRE